MVDLGLPVLYALTNGRHNRLRHCDRPIYDQIGSSAISFQGVELTWKVMARPEGLSSDALFETLSAWEHQLKHHKRDMRGPRP